ncbi:Homeobox protein engrailed-1 [Acipenser ruthenus]|uniref:Homeobox protein engrailed-1 n=1 Tax=Acipenser ruthenus TaxID=7906 RepID=A0A444UPW1_ACIRT|nr:Homeobox protein engrailed-1 [Acipenser ruthenus]
MEEQKGQSSRDSSEGESVSLSPNLPSPLILPHPAAQQAHRTTNFFIDNILRPDFGCKKEPGNRDRAQTSRRENVNPLIIRPSNPSTLCQDSNCSSDSASSSSSSSSSSSPSSKQSQLKQDEGNGTNTTKYGENNNSTMIVSLNKGANAKKDAQPLLWPAWVYCTRYSDRPSSDKHYTAKTLWTESQQDEHYTAKTLRTESQQDKHYTAKTLRTESQQDEHYTAKTLRTESKQDGGQMYQSKCCTR